MIDLQANLYPSPLTYEGQYGESCRRSGYAWPAVGSRFACQPDDPPVPSGDARGVAPRPRAVIVASW